MDTQYLPMRPLAAIAAVTISLATSAFAQQVETAVACDEGTEPTAITYGDHTSGCEVNPVTDLDRFVLCGTSGDLLRINVFAGGNFMDPLLEVRDPGAVLIETASCNDSCAVSTQLELSADGCYTLFVSDVGANETGSYLLQTARIEPVAGDAVAVGYDETLNDAINVATDIDSFTFEAVAGTDLRLNVLSAGNFMDPTVEIRDPAGAVVVSGAGDGATCNDSCSFSRDFTPASSGTYSMIIYDRGGNETGSYSLSLWCLSGSCPGIPDPSGPTISYVTDIAGEIESGVDGDFYRFNATAGTELRLAVQAAGNFMDPTVEIRDPAGALVVAGVSGGASCNDSCSFSVDFSPVSSGFYTLLIYDRTTNETGTFGLALWCLHGPCDSDADGLLDGTPRVSFSTPVTLAYGIPANDLIEAAVDSDIYIFGGTAGDLVRLNVFAGGNFMDPLIEIRDPLGVRIVNGFADGAACNDSCSFSIDIALAVTGTYSLAIYDSATNETGDYEIGLQCLVGTCADAVPVCSDNCIDFANSATVPDAGGNAQLDTNGDGYGNACDPDLNDDGMVNFTDLNIIRAVFFGDDDDADLNGDNSVNFADLNRMKALFFGAPGPACTVP